MKRLGLVAVLIAFLAPLALNANVLERSISIYGSELVESGVVAAGNGTNALPRALQGGEANTHVYFGVRNGERVYTGITNDIARRQAQHGGRFVLKQITESPVTRGQARAIEQALITRNPGFQNIRNSISPNHSWYQQAVDWGESWLRTNGVVP
jgi:hypothetical protein